MGVGVGVEIGVGEDLIGVDTGVACSFTILVGVLLCISFLVGVTMGFFILVLGLTGEASAEPTKAGGDCAGVDCFGFVF